MTTVTVFPPRFFRSIRMDLILGSRMVLVLGGSGVGVGACGRLAPESAANGFCARGAESPCQSSRGLGMIFFVVDFEVSEVSEPFGLGADCVVGVEQHVDGASIDVVHAEDLDGVDAVGDFVVEFAGDAFELVDAFEAVTVDVDVKSEAGADRKPGAFEDP